MSKIVVVGSINMDLVITTPRVPAMGETILGSGFMTSHGGKGANQAVAAAKLGGEVAMVGCVGNDGFGKQMIENLEGNGIDINNVKMLNGFPTGVAVILIEDGNNCIIVDPGANAELKPADIERLEGLIKDSNIVIIQLEIPLETVKCTLELARKNNVKVLLNPAPAVKLRDELLKMVDILTPNESECEIITGIQIESIEDAKSAVEYLLGKGIKTVVVTLGKNGVVYNCGSEIIHKPVPEVAVVDTTAAGDSFSGALAVAISSDEDINKAIDFANAVGTITVTKKGAQASLPSLQEVREYMKNMAKL